MKPIRKLVLIVCAAFGLCAPASALDLPNGPFGPPPAHASLYSFSDVFRLTVAGAAMADSPLAAGLQSAPAPAEFPMRVVAAEPQRAGYVFSIAAERAPESWLLLFSGLALACWVARRRLIHAF